MPLWPIQPLPNRPGTCQLYYINVREEWDEDLNASFRLYNHDSVAGERLFKGYGPSKRPIAWPFHEEPSWMIHATAEAAESARARLQTYLDQIARK